MSFKHYNEKNKYIKLSGNGTYQNMTDPAEIEELISNDLKYNKVKIIYRLGNTVIINLPEGYGQVIMQKIREKIGLQTMTKWEKITISKILYSLFAVVLSLIFMIFSSFSLYSSKGNISKNSENIAIIIENLENSYKLIEKIGVKAGIDKVEEVKEKPDNSIKIPLIGN